MDMFDLASQVANVNLVSNMSSVIKSIKKPINFEIINNFENNGKLAAPKLSTDIIKEVVKPVAPKSLPISSNSSANFKEINWLKVFGWAVVIGLGTYVIVQIVKEIKEVNSKPKTEENISDAN